MESKTLSGVIATSDQPLVQVNSLLIPVQEGQLLVPQLSVAEVLSSGDVCLEDPSDSSPCYGWINWRYQYIPLLSFDGVYSGSRPPLDPNFKMVVFNAVFNAAAVGFYGLVVKGFPRALRLSSEAEPVLGTYVTDQAGVQMEVNIDGERAWIPDFQVLEKIVQELVEQRGSS